MDADIKVRLAHFGRSLCHDHVLLAVSDYNPGTGSGYLYGLLGTLRQTALCWPLRRAPLATSTSPFLDPSSPW